MTVVKILKKGFIKEKIFNEFLLGIFHWTNWHKFYNSSENLSLGAIAIG